MECCNTDHQLSSANTELVFYKNERDDKAIKSQSKFDNLKIVRLLYHIETFNFQQPKKKKKQTKNIVSQTS